MILACSTFEHCVQFRSLHVKKQVPELEKLQERAVAVMKRTEEMLYRRDYPGLSIWKRGGCGEFEQALPNPEGKR